VQPGNHPEEAPGRLSRSCFVEARRPPSPAYLPQRNAALKPAPEAWQAAPLHTLRALDFAIFFDHAVYAAVVADLGKRADGSIATRGADLAQGDVVDLAAKKASIR
jgi:hypothetical protein